MPNFHPQLVAAVTPLLDPGEEVWAVFASPRRSLVATASHLFVLTHQGTALHPLDEFIVMRRPRPSLVIIERRDGQPMVLHVDPRDEHGIQALTVIGLLLAVSTRSREAKITSPAPARAAPSTPQRVAIHRHVLRGQALAGRPSTRLVWRCAGPKCRPRSGSPAPAPARPEPERVRAASRQGLW